MDFPRNNKFFSTWVIDQKKMLEIMFVARVNKEDSNFVKQ